MDRGELARRVANRTQLGHLGTLFTVDVVFDVIGEALAQREDVTIMNFGRFTTMDRLARTGAQSAHGRDPRVTGLDGAGIQAGQGPQGRPEYTLDRLCGTPKP